MPRPPSASGRFSIRTFAAARWFDDIRVSQVPLVAISTDHAANVFRRSDPLLLHVNINDRDSDDLSARLILRDAIGRTIYQNSEAINLSDAVLVAPGKRQMTLPLPDTLPAGWYQASLETSSRGTPLGREKMQSHSARG